MSHPPTISQSPRTGLTGWLLAAAITFTRLASASTPDADDQWSALTFDLNQRAAIQQRAGETLHPASLLQPSDRDPLDVLLRRTGALLDDLKGRVDLTAAATELDALRAEAEKVAPTDAAARRAVFDRVLPLRRRIAFTNPLLDFKDILFVKRHRSIFEHMCDQFYGITARPGGGLYVLEDAFGPSPKIRDVLADATVANGRLKGQKLVGGNGAKLNMSFDGVRRLTSDPTEGGAFLSPALSYDGKSILFSYVECTGGKEQLCHTDATRGHWDEGRSYHLFRVGLDGTGPSSSTCATSSTASPPARAAACTCWRTPSAPRPKSGTYSPTPPWPTVV